VPKFGFKNINRVDFNTINVGDLQKLIDSGKLKETSLSAEFLLSNNFLKNKNKPLKILGNGELKSKLEISADAFSKTAIEKIESMGGKAIII
jgi:large subunit ribosomal protein L15